MLLHRRDHAIDGAGGEHDVAIVDDRVPVERVEIPWPYSPGIVDEQRLLADGAGAESGFWGHVMHLEGARARIRGPAPHAFDHRDRV